MANQTPHQTNTAPPGWCDINEAAVYAGVKPRTIRSWMKQGLRHVVVTQKTKLTKFEHIDEFLNKFYPSDGQVIKDMATEIFNNVVGQN